MQRSKKTKFPPALEENLHDIYRYSLIRIIEVTLENINLDQYKNLNFSPETDILDVNDNLNKITQEFNIAKRIETIIQIIEK